MPPLSHLPAARILAGYAVGCSAAFFLPSLVLPLCILVVFILLCAAALRWHTLLFWAMLILMGLWSADTARGLPLRIESRTMSEIPAVVWGRIERVLYRDSSVVRCVLHGTVDTRPMKAHNNTRIVLSVVRPNATAMHFLQPGNSIAASARVRLPYLAALPGEFSEQVYYSSLGVEWVGIASTHSVALTEPQVSAEAFAQRAASAISSELSRLFPERSRGIAIALLTGDRSHLGQATKDTFMLTGTTHVLAVSGLHVGILAAIILLPLARLHRPVLRGVVFSLALLVYTMLTGMQPSMIRAAIMAVLLLIVSDAQRTSHLLNVLCFTVVIMLLFDPHLLFSTGFQLSVVSLGGIAVLYPAAERTLGLFLQSQSAAVRFIRSSLAVTLSASAASSPVVAWSFSVFSVVSPFANLLVIPLMSLGMIYALCALAAAQVSGWCGKAFACAADALFFIAELFNRLAASLPVAAVTGRYALIPALCSALATLYIVCAQTRRLVVFRVAVSASGAVLLCLLVSGNESCIEIIPRVQLVAVVVPTCSGRTLVLLQDRRPDMYPKRDMGLEKYLDAKSDTTTIIACGAASMRCAAGLRRTKVDAVIAQTLLFKNKGLWMAMDSLEAHGVPVLNAAQWLSARKPVVLRSGSAPVCWDAWQNSVSLHTPAGNRHVVLPRVVAPVVFSGAE